jgi:outer membrane protein TolC
VRPSASAGASVALPSALPAELLGRRPDLTAQRLRIEVLSHDIASARAEFYPNVNLAAFVGFQSLGAAGFLTSASRMAGFGPAITLPIFDAGRLRGNLAAKNAGYDIAVEQYNQMLADALRDVVDQIASFRSVDEQRAQQALAVATSRQAYDLALLRYREGLGNYLQVLTTEAQWLSQQSLDAELQARRLALSIDLVRALGGGFDPSSAALAGVARAPDKTDNMTTTSKRSAEGAGLPAAAWPGPPGARARVGAAGAGGRRRRGRADGQAVSSGSSGASSTRDGIVRIVDNSLASGLAPIVILP